MGQPLAGPLFGKDNLPVDFDEELGGHAWAEFQKLGVTKALRIEGTFRVITIHGGDPQVCHDGYLALDSQGHPYPIDRKVFEETFEPATDSLVATAKAMAEELAAPGFSTSDGSDDPNRRSLIDALNAFVGDREA